MFHSFVMCDLQACASMHVSMYSCWAIPVISESYSDFQNGLGEPYEDSEAMYFLNLDLQWVQAILAI